ncbi:MAG TPA: beta-ketoacyl-ACP synthase III [Atribacteraceae bacterium]|nr:beta-ketoacyl-ACP synthase III [Atribacteraceae bacterium]
MNERFVKILGIGTGIPEACLTNRDLERMVETSDEWITSRSGIAARRIAAHDEPASALAVTASRKALEDAGIDASELDLIIVATVTPDMLFPATACLVQNEIGARKAACFDLEAGCTGFVYALSIAEKYLTGGGGRKALVIGVETLSKIVDWQDRSTCVLFGDGAGAAVLGLASEPGIYATYLGADGSGGRLLELPAGGSRFPASSETLSERLHFIHMNGNEVFKFAVRIMEEASREVLRRAGMSIEVVDLFIPHQANIRIIHAAAKRLAVSPDRIFVNVHKYGNTSSASIPIALSEAREEGRIQDGSLVLLVGFGAGLTWGSALIRW